DVDRRERDQQDQPRSDGRRDRPPPRQQRAGGGRWWLRVRLRRRDGAGEHVVDHDCQPAPPPTPGRGPGRLPLRESLLLTNRRRGQAPQRAGGEEAQPWPCASLTYFGVVSIGSPYRGHRLPRSQRRSVITATLSDKRSHPPSSSRFRPRKWLGA